ncbi:MAG: hypothetical protein ACI4WW_05395 [Candidatus Coprovivens sp.]
MKNLKKLFVLMMAFSLVTFGNVYAEEIAVIEDVEVTEEGTIVDEDGTALAGDGSFTITDDALLNIAGGLTGEAEENETIDYRDMDIALEDEPKITEEEDNLLTILAVVTVAAVVVVALIVVLIVRNKKKKALVK